MVQFTGGTPPGVKVEAWDAKQIIVKFLKYAKSEQTKDGNVNILRISGGEPFMSPALIEDIAEEFATIEGLDGRFLWVDTNLYPFGTKLDSKQEAALDALVKLGPRVAVHACIHGASPKTLLRNSKKTIDPENLSKALQAFDQKGIPIYPRINPAGLSPSEVKEIFKLLSDASQVNPFPLRTYLGPIELLYEHAIDRMKVFQGQTPLFVNEARPLPTGCTKSTPHLMPANAAIFEWNRLLEEHYGVGYARIPRHMTAGIHPLTTAVSRPEREWDNVILLCKGWEKEVYAQKLLEIMSVPDGAHVEVEFENTWIEPGLLSYAFACPTFFKKRLIKVLVTSCYRERKRGMIPVRWGLLKGLSSTDYRSENHSLNFTLEMWDYATDLQERIPGVEGEGFFEKMAQYVGLEHLPFAGYTSYFCQYIGFEKTKKKPIAVTYHDQDFKRAVIELVKPNYKEAKRDIYFRIKAIEDVDKDKTLYLADGILKVTEGQELRIVFEACNPNMDKLGYPSTDDAQIRLLTTEVDNVSIAPQYLRLSKYGEPTARLSFKRSGEYSGDILIEPAHGGVRIPSFRIPFRVEVEK